MRVHYGENVFRFECSTNVKQSLEGLTKIIELSKKFKEVSE